ncbi:AAA-ATPase [Microbacterium phage Nebulous]|nr:AAA-ATPase [Microbacterium phage Nebulous]
MFIAFEGPDMTGKSTSAQRLDCAGQPDYNATREMHLANQADMQDAGLMPHTYDRIDWFTHMVYRLALPDRNWNDDRPRTVFAMPDTHLVVKIHNTKLADFTAEEVVDTPIARVNPMYYYFADFFMGLNRARDYELFKTVSIMEVFNDQSAGTFSQRMVAFDSPTSAWDTGLLPLERLVDSDDSLLAFLQDVDQTIG